MQVGHELGTGSAVKADGEQAGGLERHPERVGGLPGEHGAHDLNGAGDHDGDLVADVPHDALGRDEGCLDIAGVDGGLDEDDVNAALDELADLLIEVFFEFAEADAAGDRERLGGGTNGSGDETGLGRSGEGVGGVAGQFGGAQIEVARLVADAELGENQGGRAEAVGFDDVRTGGEVGAVDVADDVGARFDEILGAVLEHGATAIGDGEFALLEHGAHGPVEDEDAGGECVKKRLLALGE